MSDPKIAIPKATLAIRKPERQITLADYCRVERLPRVSSLAFSWSIFLRQPDGQYFQTIHIGLEKNRALELRYREDPDRFDRDHPIPGLVPQYTPVLHRQLYVSRLPLELPLHWNQIQSHTCQLFDLGAESEEYLGLARIFLEQMPGREIQRVQRVQNLIHYQRYHFERARIASECVDVALEETGSTEQEVLFHGTMSTDPIAAIQSQHGLDPRLSSLINLWGPAIYFSPDPSYADQFAHRKPNGERQILCAGVATGSVFNYGLLRCPSLTQPPLDPITGTRYHSVTGKMDRYDVYGVYRSDQILLRYLITYRKDTE